MKIAALIAAAGVAFAGVGAAHAQTGSCNQMLLLLTADQMRLGELRGAEIERDAKKITHVSKTQVIGFSDCKLKWSIENNKYDSYNTQHISCSGDFADSEAATKYVEGLFACVKDMAGKRKPTENRLGGAYRVTEFDADVYPAGRDAAFLFNKSNYTRLWVAKGFPGSSSVNLNMYFSYLKPDAPG
ncbi:MAG TPA: hypothetical protein PLN33_01710 [Hyphomonadaceae bacterium]|nr:hypothetical protein [Hyphomonadaceae bacterium]HPN05936.1 hypothetical protein [Hyphomonadaceae bacterium]